MTSARRSNQFSISTRDHCYFPRNYFPVFGRHATSDGLGKGAFRDFVKTKEKQQQCVVHAILRGTRRTWCSTLPRFIYLASFSRKKYYGDPQNAKSATQNLWHYRHASATRGRSGFRDSFSKGGFKVFLDALFRPGGTDLAVASVLLVCARTNHKRTVQQREKERERREEREREKERGLSCTGRINL